MYTKNSSRGETSTIPEMRHFSVRHIHLVKFDRMNYIRWWLALTFVSGVIHLVCVWAKVKNRKILKMSLSPDAKERLGVVFEVAKTVFHWGFIPTVIYLGKNCNYHSTIANISHITTQILHMKFLVPWIRRIPKRSRSWAPTSHHLKVGIELWWKKNHKLIDCFVHFPFFFSVCCGNKSGIPIVKHSSQRKRRQRRCVCDSFE